MREYVVLKESMDKALNRSNEMGLIEESNHTNLANLEMWNLKEAGIRKQSVLKCLLYIEYIISDILLDVNSISINMTCHIDNAIKCDWKYEFIGISRSPCHSKTLCLAWFYRG